MAEPDSLREALDEIATLRQELDEARRINRALDGGRLRLLAQLRKVSPVVDRAIAWYQLCDGPLSEHTHPPVERQLWAAVDSMTVLPGPATPVTQHNIESEMQ